VAQASGMKHVRYRQGDDARAQLYSVNARRVMSSAHPMCVVASPSVAVGLWART